MTNKTDATAILIAEYEFVSGLIPLYRRVEITAVAGAGVITAAILGAIAVMESATEPVRAAEAVLLALAPWGFLLLVLVQITALLRIQRASSYIRGHLKPLAYQLTDTPNLLEWEIVHTRDLLTSTKGWSWIAVGFVASVPMILVTALPALPAPIFARELNPGGLSTWYDVVLVGGWVGAVLTAVAAGFGIYISVAREWPRTIAE